MNRRQKIIVSVTGIFIVLLILIGLTYAYFLTKISGNTNSKSISVSTANLALVYGDGNGVLEVGEVLTPGNSIKFKTSSGDTVDKKTFTVTNEGNATTDYVVVIEDVNVTYTSTVQVDGETHTAGSKTTFTSNDFVYTLTCTSGCNGVSTETTFPITGGILVGNNIEVGKTQTYELSMKYLETGENQSADMNKTLTAKLNIKDIGTLNPYSKNTDSLAYNIINNSVLGKNGTTLKAVPDTIPAEEKSWTKGTGKYEEQELDMSAQSSWYYADTYNDAQPWNGGSNSGKVSECSDTIVGKYISYSTVDESWYVKSCKSSTVAIFATEINDYESELSVTQDDLGTSYYYRGNVEDNYVNFAGMCWRIVRIAGDGSTKLILEDKNTTCESSTYTGNWSIGTGNYGYTSDYVTNSSGATSSSKKSVADYVNGQTNNTSSMKYKLDVWLESSGIDTTKLKQDNWCLGNLTDAYDDSGTLLTGSRNDFMYNYNGTFRYDTNVRLYGKGTTANATLKCSGENYETYSSYIGALTADEVVFAGGTTGILNINFYLNNNATTWWTLSPSHFWDNCDNAFYVQSGGSLYTVVSVKTSFALRPAVSLASGTEINSGDGSISNPYTIK